MYKFTCLLILAALFFVACNNKKGTETKPNSKNFEMRLDRYYQERIQLIPLEATQNSDTTQNDKLYADFTDSYRAKLHGFFNRYTNEIRKFKRDELNDDDRVSFDIIKREMDVNLEGLSLGYFTNYVLYPEHQYMPFNQFGGVPLWLGQLGSGQGSQPFKSTLDYENWIKRATAFSTWADSAVIYFRKGIAANIVLPQALVKKMIPQLDAMVVTDPRKSLFYGPVSNIPKSFSSSDRQRFTTEYVKLIQEQLVPSYKKLSEFLKTEYLPKASTTTGISSLPQGPALYDHLIHVWTTTTKIPEEIYQTGLAEVKRIRSAMDSVKNGVGFKGDLKAFFAFMTTDKQFTPYRTPGDVLQAFRVMQVKIDPNLKKMFNRVPKAVFEIRQTEDFRAASASPEYNLGSADGKRPGIFYVPILDATKYRTTSGMESLFLHEAIPGHHYQISLQMENETLPKFRRFTLYGAYVEGWALYCESLGKELGLYTDPYQYMGALGDEIHRAIRLVVDVGMHTKNMTREEAIQYMMENEPIDEQGAVAEIERYMGMPAQALSYKIGALKIRELRNKYKQRLGTKFDLAAFHDEILEGGSMPLEILERKMDAWAERQ
jgi:uncharacterized protein (DUF885 family)